MGNTKKKTKRINAVEREILSQIVDHGTLVGTNPELFDFDSLTFGKKLELLRVDVAKYSFLIKDKLSVSDKVIILMDKTLKKLHHLNELSEDEITALDNDRYVCLVSNDFNKYIRKDRFLTLGKRTQGVLFRDNPEWYVKEISATEHPKLTSETLCALSARKPDFIDTYIKNYSGLSTNSFFWINMINFNVKYRKIFLENTNSMLNKSEVRAVFWKYPTLIKLIDDKMILNMKLSSKEILLLIDQILKKKEKMFEDWAFTDELKEALRLDITAELLTGTSKLSKRLTSSLKAVTEEKIEEEINETETVE